MSDLRTAAQQALEAWDGGDIEWFKRAYTVMENLRAALAQQAEPVEPVAWAFRHSDGTYHDPSVTEHSAGMAPLYTAPPQRTMVPLTEEEIYHATGHCGVSKYTAINIARVIEEASWEKNHG